MDVADYKKRLFAQKHSWKCNENGQKVLVTKLSQQWLRLGWKTVHCVCYNISI